MMDELFKGGQDEEEWIPDLDFEMDVLSDEDREKYSITETDSKEVECMMRGIKSLENAGYEFVSRDESGRKCWLVKFNIGSKIVEGMVNLEYGSDLEWIVKIAERVAFFDNEGMLYRSGLKDGKIFLYYETESNGGIYSYIRMYTAKECFVKEEYIGNVAVKIFDDDTAKEPSYIFVRYDNEEDTYVMLSPFTSRKIIISRECLVHIKGFYYCAKFSQGCYLFDAKHIARKKIEESEFDKYGISNYQEAPKGFGKFDNPLLFSKYDAVNKILNGSHVDIWEQKTKPALERILEATGAKKYCDRERYSFWVHNAGDDDAFGLAIVNNNRVDELGSDWLESRAKCMLYGYGYAKQGIVYDTICEGKRFWVSQPVGSRIFIKKNYDELWCFDINSGEFQQVKDMDMRIRTYYNDEGRIILIEGEAYEEKQTIMIFDCDGTLLHNETYDIILDEYVNFIHVYQENGRINKLIDVLTGKIFFEVVDGGFAVHRHKKNNEIVVETIYNCSSDQKGHCYRYIDGNMYPMSRELEIFPEFFSNKRTSYIDERVGYAEQAYLDAIHIIDGEAKIIYQKDISIKDGRKHLFSWK